MCIHIQDEVGASLWITRHTSQPWKTTSGGQLSAFYKSGKQGVGSKWVCGITHLRMSSRAASSCTPHIAKCRMLNPSKSLLASAWWAESNFRWFPSPWYDRRNSRVLVAPRRAALMKGVRPFISRQLRIASSTSVSGLCEMSAWRRLTLVKIQKSRYQERLQQITMKSWWKIPD